MTDDDGPSRSPLWKRDFPYEAAAEDEVTRREFARYLVLGAGAMAAGNVGLAVWTQLRSDQHRRARDRSSPLADVAVGGTYLFRYPADDDPADPRCASPTRDVVAFSQKCTHLGCVVYYEADEEPLALPVPRGQLRRPHRRRASPARRRDRSAASTSRSATTA